MPFLEPPPSSVTGPLAEWLLVLWRSYTKMPNVSAFSGATPNGVVVGVPGDLAINLTSATSDLRLYQKGGSTRVPSNTGWVLV